MKTIIKTIGEYIKSLVLPTISEFKELQSFNRLEKDKSVTLRSQIDKILTFKNDVNWEFCPIIEALIMQSKKSMLYRHLKQNIAPNKQGAYSSYKILMYLNKNKEMLQTTYLAK